jgi:hypothetical protein
MLRSPHLPLFVTLLVACNEPTRGCDVCTYSAVVYGSVTSSTGVPAAGAMVRAHTGLRGCDETDHVATVVADGNGFYRFQVQAGVATPGCVQIEVSMGSVPTTPRIAVPSVQFKLTSEASLPYDSVRVDVQLP